MRRNVLQKRHFVLAQENVEVCRPRQLLYRRRNPYTPLFKVFILLVIALCTSSALAYAEVVGEAPGTEEAVATAPSTDGLPVASMYTFQPKNMLLIVHPSGQISSFDMQTRRRAWTTESLGGEVMQIDIKTMPSTLDAKDDPFAYPFVVKGNALYTQTPLREQSGWPRYRADAASLTQRNSYMCVDSACTDGPPETKETASAPRPSFAFSGQHFFMNVSTLLRRQAVLVGDTDVYCTTSVSVADVNAENGDILMWKPPHGGRRFYRHKTEEEESMRSIVPIVHVVRYDVVIQVSKRDGYEWSMTLSQFRLLELGASARSQRVYRESSSDPSGEPTRPLFFSHYMEDVLRHDGAADETTAKGSGPAASAAASKEIELAGKQAFSMTAKTIETAFVIKETNASCAAIYDLRTGREVISFNLTSSPRTAAGGHVFSAFLWIASSDRIARLPVVALAPRSVKVSSASNNSAQQLALTHHLSQVGTLIPYQYGTWSPALEMEDNEEAAQERYYKNHAVWYQTTHEALNDIASAIARSGGVGGGVSISSISIGGGGAYTAPSEFSLTVLFHLIGVTVSVAFIAVGTMWRGRLFLAWEQSERNRHIQPVVGGSKPSSTRILPLDLRRTPYQGSHLPPALTLSGENDLGSVTAKSLAQIKEASTVNDDHSGHSFAASCTRQRISSKITMTEEESSDGENWWMRPLRTDNAATANNNNNNNNDDDNGDDTTDDDHSSSVSSSHPSPTGTQGTSDIRLFQLNFKIIERIGFGAEGSVFCVEHRVTKVKYAIKIIIIDDQEEDRVVKEAILHSELDHQNIVRFYFCWIEDVSVAMANRLELLVHDDDMDVMSAVTDDVTTSNGFTASNGFTKSNSFTDSSAGSSSTAVHRMLFIQTEYCAVGTLADLLGARLAVRRLDNLRNILQVAEGLSYLHSKEIVHRDLKPSNIFVSRTHILKIGDFGLAKTKPPKAASVSDLNPGIVGHREEISVVGGSPLYCSPEQTRGDAVLKPSDIFSLGVIAIELYCCFNTLHERIHVLTEAHQQRLPDEVKPSYPERKLFHSMLAELPQKRPTIKKVIHTLKKIIIEEEKDSEDADSATTDQPLVSVDDVDQENSQRSVDGNNKSSDLRGPTAGHHKGQTKRNGGAAAGGTPSDVMSRRQKLGEESGGASPLRRVDSEVDGPYELESSPAPVRENNDFSAIIANEILLQRAGAHHASVASLSNSDYA